tara:strand:+ start:5567 stop:5791 length:225 start_codon:yes stop_codon:yes gene_type:complete
MKNNNFIYEQCLKTLNSQEFKKEVKNILQPLLDYILKEISIYLFFFIFLILVSFLLHLGVLVLLIRYNNKIKEI